MTHTRFVGAAFGVALAFAAVACGGDASSGAACFDEPDIDAVSAPADRADGRTIRLATHGSFALSDGTLEAFTDQTGIEVEVISGADAGALVAEAILTKDNPTADVLFGIDNAFLCRGLQADLFTPYEAAGLAAVDADLQLDPHHRVTPISYGDVCVNWWTDALPGDPPTSLADLATVDFTGTFVTQNPETSSPGFAFLLATIAEFGDDWESYWADLVNNDVVITAGWEDAYYGEFVAGGGNRPLVTSYASSPPAEVIFAAEPVEEPPTGVLDESCFRQIEFAGILQGTEEPEAAAALVEFMLGETYQADVPLNMFVYPANAAVDLPAEFVEFGQLTDSPYTLDPAEIEAQRDVWTARWTEIVLG